jgi:hypothetical protein
MIQISFKTTSPNAPNQRSTHPFRPKAHRNVRNEEAQQYQADAAKQSVEGAA